MTSRFAKWCLRLLPVCGAVWLGATVHAQAIQVKVSTGENHGVWLKADGSVWTWGSNSDGQLGTDGDHAWAVVRVPGLSGIRDVAAGDRFTMAVTSDGAYGPGAGTETANWGMVAPNRLPNPRQSPD
jgi:alpha-tubulin suppressor-like RCC1 family protein